MPNDEAARQPDRSAPIRTPDQLQQARRPDVPRSSKDAGRPHDGGEATRNSGILDQLQTERAHD